MMRKGDRYLRLQTGETYEIRQFAVVDTPGSENHGAPVVICECVETGREMTFLREFLVSAAFRRASEMTAPKLLSN